MIGGILLVVLLYAATIPMLQIMKRRMPWFQVGMMKNLYWFHMLFLAIYYIFALFARSDSQDYFTRPQEQYADWFSAYATGTPFIDFVGYPFINWLGFSYEMMMVMFACMGYWGFVFFYVYTVDDPPHARSNRLNGCIIFRKISEAGGFYRARCNNGYALFHQ